METGMFSAQIEQRRAERHPGGGAAAFWAVSGPWDSSPIVRFDGVIENMSEDGLCLRLWPITAAEYLSMLRWCDYARVRATLPGGEQTTEFVGSIAWSEHTDALRSAECRLGLRLLDPNQEASARLRGAAESLRRIGQGA